MIFSSLQYFVFLPLVVILYWHLRGTARLALVVAASYYFYMSWLPIYGILLAFLTTANWALGLAIDHRSHNRALAKTLLGLGLTLNLGALFYYKYTNFFVSNLLAGVKWLGVKAGVPVLAGTDFVALNVLLPLGISFFVFEFVHYLVDVYKGTKPVKSWLEFAAFAVFFPSQIAGPIKRVQDFMGKLRMPEPLTNSLFFESMALIVQGLYKKVAIADPIGAIIYSSFSATAPLSAPDALFASIGFVIQVYCDFSGYTDIGRGSALLMGIRLPENFELPYLAHDLADFWRRWHMSLSSWLRDYVYIPLGGSRKSRLFNWRNLFLTMLACGLWHGAAWHYVVFGCLQGVGLCVHREWRHLLSKVKPLGAALGGPVGLWFGTFVTMSYITITYTIFRAPDMPRAWNVLASWFAGGAFTLSDVTLRSGVIPLLVLYFCYWLATLYRQQVVAKPASPEITYVPLFPVPLRVASWTAAVILVLAARPLEATPFVYFQF